MDSDRGPHEFVEAGEPYKSGSSMMPSIHYMESFLESGDTPNGWFIWWNILRKWMIWGYPHLRKSRYVTYIFIFLYIYIPLVPCVILFRTTFSCIISPFLIVCSAFLVGAKVTRRIARTAWCAQGSWNRMLSFNLEWRFHCVKNWVCPKMRCTIGYHSTI